MKIFGMKKLVVLLVVFGLVLAGCGGPKGEEIVFWNPFAGADGETFQSMVDGFNEEYAGQYYINSQTTANDGNAYYDKIKTAAQSGDEPDLAIMHIDEMPTYASNNVIVPWSQEELAAIGVAQDMYSEEIYNASVIDDELLGVNLVVELSEEEIVEPDILIDSVDFNHLTNYFNQYMKYTLKGIATNPDIVPNNNLIYDFVTILRADNTEVNLCFSYTNIFLTVVSTKKCIEHDVLTKYLHTDFHRNFRKAIIAEINRNAEHFGFDYELFEPIAHNMYVYKLPTDIYPVNFRTIMTKNFDKNSKSSMTKLFDNREKVTRIFATYGELV